MVRISFLDPGGHRHDLDVAPGTTLMEAATAHDVPGIVGFCGGMCACGTCHCYVDAEWASRLPPADEDELDTLRRVIERRRESRLGCQVRVAPGLAGLTVRVPARQPTP